MALETFLALLLFPPILLILRLIYRISPFHPLSHIPSNHVPTFSSLWLVHHAWLGSECTAVHKLHQRYGPVVRTGPNSVDIADGAALHPIYVEKGGFRKAGFYANFDVDGHRSIFSELLPSRRAPRAKAVAPLFSTASLEQGKEVIYGCVDRWIERVKAEKKSRGGTVDLLNLCRALALDGLTSYLFHKCYDALAEPTDPSKNTDVGMSANGMVDGFVAANRYWYLPGWAFSWIAWMEETIWPDKEAAVSMSLVDEFVVNVVEQARKSTELKSNENLSYPARLLEAGCSESETRAQCKDAIFAGTDSTGMNLATICFLLAQNPEKYARLRQELLDANTTTQDDDNGQIQVQVQSLPYLRAVVKEGLRLSMANPSRLTRVVPIGGWTFKEIYLPAGTEVSCTPYELHLNAAVFGPDPLAFRPERWLEDTRPTDDMKRDWIAFGQGLRQCIARNLATVELHCAVHRLVQVDLLRGARCGRDKIELLQWFNAKVIEGKIELKWE